MSHWEQGAAPGADDPASERPDVASAIPRVQLNNGVAVPQIGYGVFQVPPEDTQRSVEEALNAGYRHVDTAASYGNEAAVGRAVAVSGLPRSDVFITTKLTIPGQQDPVAAFERSRAALGDDRVDLYLIHWPAPARNLYVRVWKALEKIYAEGSVRAIGVSNFLPHHLDALLDEAEVVPAVNQIELHPTFQQRTLADKCRTLGIAVEAFTPLGRGADLTSYTIRTVAERHGASPAQVVLAWSLQQGNIVLPKTVRPERMRENLRAVELELSDNDRAAVDQLEAGVRIATDPDVKA